MSSFTDVGIARLYSITLSTVAHRSPMLLAGSVSDRTHSKWWWCHDIGYPLLAAEHSLCKAPWSGTPCQTTSTHSRSMSSLDSAWKSGFSLAASVLSALETSWQWRYINLRLPLPLHIFWPWGSIHDVTCSLLLWWYSYNNLKNPRQLT